MIAYVTFGGMLATTWVQIIKACMLLGGATFMAFMVLWNFGFSPEAMFAKAVEIKTALAAKGGASAPQAAAAGQSIMGPGNFVKDPISAISFGMALMFGTAGLPHILMRFFTVADARQARLSVLVATGFITVFYTLLFVLGFGAIALVLADPTFKDAAGNLIGGTNMVALHLADRLGGSLMLGFISAVAFATILAVVSGLTIAGASAASHDLYARVLRRGAASEQTEVRVSKAAAVVLSLTAMGLAMLFENQNIAFVVGLVFAVAASANFPVLLLSVTWRGLTTRGAVAGSLIGLLGALLLVVLSPGVWTATLRLGPAPFPYDNPALVSVPLAFLTSWLVSHLDHSLAGKAVRAAFTAQHVVAQTGFGRSVAPAFH